MGHGCGIAKLRAVGQSYIGGEFATEFVAEAQASVEIGKAAANSAGRIGMAIEIHLDFGLRNQALGNQQVVGAGDFAGYMAAIAEVKGWRKLEEMRRQAFDSDGAPGSVRAGIQILANSNLPIEVAHARDGPGI